MPLRVLFDTGIFIHADFAEPHTDARQSRWGDKEYLIEVQGIRRKALDSNLDLQHQKDALFTIGRLVREERIAAYTYAEIACELTRGSPPGKECNALSGCMVQKCAPALERSKFVHCDYKEWWKKGGRKDRKVGISLGTGNQIPFFNFLCTLGKDAIDKFVSLRELLALTDFEVENLQEINRFRLLCESSGGPEHYPDLFHLWTAERNSINVFLTLDQTFVDLVSNIKSRRAGSVEFLTEVLQPLDLLRRFEISQCDPVPLDPGRFYHYHELPNCFANKR